jgi:hypothetical protein
MELKLTVKHSLGLLQYWEWIGSSMSRITLTLVQLARKCGVTKKKHAFLLHQFLIYAFDNKYLAILMPLV